MIRDEPGHLGKLAQAIGDCGANIGDIVKLRSAGDRNLRELELYLDSEGQLNAILKEIERIDGVAVESTYDPVLEIHRGGKIHMRSTVSIDRVGDVRMIYTPGVATVCREILADPRTVYDYTAIGETVAIITNGTAILGLGNIGVHAGLPVMEGKAVLLDRLAGLSGIPILIPTRDVQTFVDTVIQITPSFGAIKLEDIAAPECFEIETRLCEALPIPVMHDDQHGTAVVALAALLNATASEDRPLEQFPIGLVGLGAAGLGIAKLLRAYGVKLLLGCDIKREAMRRLEKTGGRAVELETLMADATVVIATTGQAGLIRPDLVRPGQVILALSNPYPEIQPDVALAAGARFAADGRSVNNALGFPGIFRGALNARARRITDRMKLAAAETIAAYAEKGELVPSLLHPDVHHAVAEAVEEAAHASGATEVAQDPGA
ncbi:MAG: NAD-dependent malic enzyme [Myxococcota bacterium]